MTDTIAGAGLAHVLATEDRNAQALPTMGRNLGRTVPRHRRRKSGYVFLTMFGNPWFSDGQNRPIAAEFRKLCLALDIYRPNVTTFYTLRRTHYTIGATAAEPAASKFIMGHTPPSDDMSAVYPQKHFDASLRKVTDAIYEWLF